MNSIKLSILLFVFLNILKFNQSASITSCYSCFWSNSSSNPLNSTLQTCGGYTVPNPTPTNSINQCQITLEYWNGNLSSINISYVLDKTTFQNSSSTHCLSFYLKSVTKTVLILILMQPKLLKSKLVLKTAKKKHISLSTFS